MLRLDPWLRPSATIGWSRRSCRRVFHAPCVFGSELNCQEPGVVWSHQKEIKRKEGNHIMNTLGKALLLIQASVLSLSVFCAVGCQSHAYQKSDVAGKSLQTAAPEVQEESRAIAGA